jgi:hypothetical protein
MGISCCEGFTARGEIMNISTTVRRTVTGVVVAGVAVGVSTVAAGTASATPADHLCTAGEVTTTLVPGSPGAGQRYASVQFTANPDRGCSLRGTLELHLGGAPNVMIGNPSDTGPLVTIANGQSANMLLHWSAIDAPQQQETPTAITVTFPGAETGAPTSVTLPWQQGPMDTSTNTSGLTANTIEAGIAPAA